MNVHWTEAALADLQTATAYLARRSPRYAQSLVERILTCSERLADHPLLGAAVEEYDDKSLRELFEHPYRIIYRVVEHQVDVVAIVHAARRLPRDL